MKSRIDDLRSEFAYVLIDAPPLNSYADAVALAQATDGIVLILEANSTRRESALKITEQLQAAGVSVLGAVLNKRTFPIPKILYRIL
jgi:Mrp family chromosome partitioning ATPase